MVAQIGFRTPKGVLGFFGGNKNTTTTRGSAPFVRQPERKINSIRNKEFFRSHACVDLPRPQRVSSEQIYQNYRQDLQSILKSRFFSQKASRFKSSQKYFLKNWEEKYKCSEQCEKAIFELTLCLRKKNITPQNKKDLELLRKKYLQTLFALDLRMLYTQRFSQKNSDVSIAKRECTKNLLAVYDRFFEEKNPVCLGDLVRVMIFTLPHLKKWGNSRNLNDLKNASESLAALSFLISAPYAAIPDAFSGQSPSLDTFFLKRRVEWGMLQALSIVRNPSATEIKTIKENVTLWAKNRYLLALRTQILEKSLHSGKKKIITSFKTIKKDRALACGLKKRNRQKFEKTNLLYAFLAHFETALLQQEQNLFGHHADIKFPQRDLSLTPETFDFFSDLGLSPEQLTLLGIENTQDFSNLEKFTEQGVISTQEIEKTNHVLKKLSEDFFLKPLGMEAFAYTAQEGNMGNSDPLPSSASPAQQLITPMKPGDKIVLKTGERVFLTSGRRAIEPTGVFGLKVNAGKDQSMALDIELGREGYQVIIRGGSEAKAGVELSAGYSSPLKIAKLLATSGIEGARANLGGRTLVFPNNEQGKRDLISLLDALNQEGVSFSAKLYANAIDNAHTVEEIKRGRVAFTGTANVGFSLASVQDMGAGIGGDVTGSFTAVSKNTDFISRKEKTYKKEVELTGQISGNIDLYAHLFFAENVNYDNLGVSASHAQIYTKKQKNVFSEEGYLKRSELALYTTLKTGALSALSTVSNSHLLKSVKENASLRSEVKRLIAKIPADQDGFLLINYGLSPNILKKVNRLLGEAQEQKTQGNLSKARLLKRRALSLTEDQNNYLPRRISHVSIRNQKIEDTFCDFNFVKYGQFSEGESERPVETLDLI